MTAQNCVHLHARSCSETWVFRSRPAQNCVG